MGVIIVIISPEPSIYSIVEYIFCVLQYNNSLY